MLRQITVSIIAAFLIATPETMFAAANTTVGSFEAVELETYTHSAPDFSVRYPYALRSSPPTRKGEVFSAAGLGRAPSLNVMVLPRPADLTLARAAQAAAQQLAPNGVIKAQQAVDLGGVPGEAVTFEWSMPIGLGVDLRTQQVSAFHGDAWVIVTITDGRVGDTLAPDLTAAVNSLRFAP